MESLADGKIHLKFRRPQRAIAPTRICALYDDDRLLGGGVFEKFGYPSMRTIDNFITTLRAKLEMDPSNPRHLVTVRGVGYRLDF